MSEAEQREEAVFEAALQLEGAARLAYLDEACAGDPALRGRVESLLGALARAGGLLTKPAVPRDEATPLLPSPPGAQPGDRIGRYKLLQQIGEGGCGIVYMAEQEEPVRRRVALKVIKLGMDTKQVIARFEAERQALALMDHPNIAKVLDAGATDTGRPYFVMELVRGTKITDYCDEQQLPMKERLELFIQVCQAVQHAHQKGIIHRDLKPSNILVTVNDGVPVPKVIDFGIAKATTGQPLTDKTLFTAFEQFVGTPAYMSPEQAVMTSMDIDTRSDIYSLGVLLYELLTGKTPFDSKELLQIGLDEMRRTICEKEPARPSTRLSTMIEAELTTTAKRRHIDPPKLIHLVRGDLDWIVMKCLEKDRARRYETANGLAADLRRQLDNEPEIARPPSPAYRFQKAFRRNRLMFVAGTVVTTALLVGLGLATVGLRRAMQERNSAVAARAGEEEQRRQAQQAQAKEAQLRREAEIQELAARRRAYGSDMNLAQQALVLNNLGRAQELLNRQRPQPGQQDLRGWEWRYLWQRCRSDALFTLEGERSTIGSLAVSHDGRWLAIGENGNGMLSVWNTQTRALLTRFKAGDGDVRLAFAHRTHLLAYWCGSYLPTTGPPTPVWLWDGESSRRITNCAVAGTCQGLWFSEDDQRLAICTSAPGNEVAVWDLSTGKKLSAYQANHPGGRESTSFAASRDLSVVAYEAHDGWIKVVDLTTLEELWTAKASDERITSIAFSPDGKLLASGPGWVDSPIRLWDVRTGKEIGQFKGHNSFVSQLVFSPDGRTLASASGDQTIRLWDVTNLRPPRVFRGHKNEVWRLAPLDHQMLASGAKDGSVFIWDMTQERHESGGVVLPTPMAAWGFAPDGKSVLTLDRQGHVDKWAGQHLEKRVPLVDLGPRPIDWRSAFSPQKRLLAVGYTNGTVQVWDLERRTLQREFSGQPGPAFPIGFLAQDTKLVIFQMDDHSFHEWNLTTGAEIRSWLGPNGLSSFGPAIISPDEQWCLMPEARLMRNLATGDEQRLNISMRATENATFSPDGRRVAIASYLGFARMWKAGSWEELATFGGFLSGAHSVAFSPDSRRLATGSSGKEALKIWDTEGLQDILTLEGKSGAFLRTSFSQDGNAVGSMSTQGMLHLWFAPSLEEIEAAEAQADLQRAARLSQPEMENDPASGPVRRPALDIPRRPTEATPQMVDLTGYFHAALKETWHPGAAGNDLTSLPAGIQELQGVRFDIRGVIQLNGGGLADMREKSYPRRIEGIKIGRPCARLHFLHAAGWAVDDGTIVGRYVLRYSDGSSQTLPIVYGEDTRDWWIGTDVVVKLKHAQVAWQGLTSNGDAVRIFRRTWENPQPDREVASLEFISTMTRCAPFLLAITVE